MANPWDYAAKTRNEFAEQSALFMWANIAARFGIAAADDKASYTIPGHVKTYQLPVFGSRYDDALGCSVAVEVYPCVPELEYMHAIHNQGHGDAIRGARAKAEGVKAGAPDIMLPYPIGAPWGTGFPNGGRLVTYSGLYIELKRLKSERGAAGKASDVQTKWHNYLTCAGYKVVVCEGWEAARTAILEYLGKG